MHSLVSLIVFILVVFQVYFDATDKILLQNRIPVLFQEIIVVYLVISRNNTGISLFLLGLVYLLG